jgi:hypothetical protein
LQQYILYIFNYKIAAHRNWGALIRGEGIARRTNRDRNIKADPVMSRISTEAIKPLHASYS